jgi:hypothetical protein
MNKKTIIGFITLTLIFLFFFYLFKTNSKNITEDKNLEETTYNSNTIKDVNYMANDVSGNTYIIDAKEGEIDINDSNIIYLTDVKALIKLNNTNNINITSKFGKYNISSFDTIFSKNVVIKYLDNKITGEYLDFSINRNSMIISRNVIYSNKEDILESDVIEVNIKTKDTKIFMHNVDEKVNIKSIN